MFLAYLDGIAGAKEAERQLEQGVAYAESNGFTWDFIDGKLMLARLVERRGDASRAQKEYEAVRELALKAGNRLIADDCERAIATMSRASQAG